MSREITDINSPSHWNMRIWDVKNKEWLGQSDNDGCIFYGFDIRGGETTVFSNMNWLYNQFAHGREFIWEQSTGLKDKNGKETYEGDIIKFPDLELSMNPTGVVCFDNGKFFIKDYEFDDGSYHIVEFYDYNIPHRDLEVIGNIHENPELLEGEI